MGAVRKGGRQIVFQCLKDKFNINISYTKNNVELWTVTSKDVYELLFKLKSLPEYSFDTLLNYTAIDKIDDNIFEIFYQIFSVSLNKNLLLKVEIQRERPEIPSISNLYKSANFDEREMYDLFGITFIGHENIRRILLPNDWIGHPLRKDYQMHDERLEWNKR